jgi:hypothetical protein
LHSNQHRNSNQMNKSILLVLLGMLLWPSLGQAQTRRFNLSVQAGYQYKFLNPRPLNFALDSLADVAAGNPTDNFERIRWTPGVTGAIGYHRGRMSLRVLFNQFQGNSSFLGPDSLGVDTRREARIDGWNVGVSLDGQLIPFGDRAGVYVGGSFQISRLTTYLRSAVRGDALPDFAVVTQVTKPSFSIMLPFRIQPLPWLQLSLEPYFQVYFSPTDYAVFSRQLNGEAATSANRGKLIGETDHFGALVQVIFYLIPE